jgi:hypothetical protein
MPSTAKFNRKINGKYNGFFLMILGRKMQEMGE